MGRLHNASAGEVQYPPKTGCRYAGLGQALLLWCHHCTEILSCNRKLKTAKSRVENRHRSNTCNPEKGCKKAKLLNLHRNTGPEQKQSYLLWQIGRAASGGTGMLKRADSV